MLESSVLPGYVRYEQLWDEVGNGIGMEDRRQNKLPATSGKSSPNEADPARNKSKTRSYMIVLIGCIRLRLFAVDDQAPPTEPDEGYHCCCVLHLTVLNLQIFHGVFSKGFWKVGGSTKDMRQTPKARSWSGQPPHLMLHAEF